MIVISDPKNCCGCSACANICPKEAITMEADGLGFVYPLVNKDNCIECGLCEKVCDFNPQYKRDNLFDEPLVYGCRHKNEEELSQSQSGALSYALAEQFILEGGILYGATLSSIDVVRHHRCSSRSEIQMIRMSKYIQSDVSLSYRSIKKDLSEGNKVLFFGTPCQVAGLKSYIGNKYREQLYTCDLVCHAVPSPTIWRDYCKAIEHKYKGKIKNVIFRNKKFGWHSHAETFMIQKNNGQEEMVTKQTFRKLFYSHLIVRPSCSICHYTNLKRVGDISCGDFWGWEKFHSDWNDNKGVSLALINSERGYELFMRANLKSIKSNINECIQPQLVAPIKLSPLYNSLVKDFEKNGFVYIAKRYGDWGVLYKLKTLKGKVVNYLYNLIKELFKR